jgi:hypothetical protein
VREAEVWARAFRLWRRLLECEEFWSLLVASDLKGDYEQPVTFGEVAELRRAAPRAVYAHAAGRARDAVARGDLAEAARVFALLRAARPPAPLLRDYEEETVGQAEDRLTEELDTAFCWVGTPAFDAKPAAERRNVCNAAWRRFADLRARLADFARLAGAESPYARRVFEHASSKLFKLAVAFEGAERKQEALFVCRKARALAPPEAEELREIEAKLAALGAAGELRERGGAEYAQALAREVEDARVPPKLFRDDPKGPKPLDAYTRKSDAPGCLTSAAFWLLMAFAGFGLRACVGGPPRTYVPINSLPAVNLRPAVNLDLNLNYNIPPPPDINVYTVNPPRARRTPRGRKRRPAPDADATPAR